MKPRERSTWIRAWLTAVLVLLAHLARAAVPMVSAGYGYTIAVDHFGSVYTWGANFAGELGDGTMNPSYAPINVPGLTGIVTVAAGGTSAVRAFSFAVRSDGVVYAWGDNDDGELGLGNTSPGPLSPTQIPGFSNALSIAAGADFAIALKKDGTVWACGANTYGQLGKGDNFPSTSPLQVPGLANIVKVSAGQYHALALRADGVIFGWGYNGEGQVGNGTHFNSLVPVQVTGLPGPAVDIMAGWNESLAVMPDGSVRGWGQDFIGEMGDLAGGTAGKLSPVRALGFMPRIVKLANGCYGCETPTVHALDGRLWKWGLGGRFALGDGVDQDTNPVPQMLSGSPNQGAMASTAALQGHLVRADGSVRGWGDNTYGQTGTTTILTGNVPIPAPVLGVGGAPGTNLNLGNYAGRKSNFSGANADGWLLWRLPSIGANTLWRLNGNTIVTNQAITGVGTTWHVAGTGDLNGDGKADIVWVEAGGAIVVWQMNGTTITSSAVIGAVPAGWSLVAVGDLNGDGKDDLVFRSNTGVVAAWIMDGIAVRDVEVIGSQSPSYQLVWLGDFDGNGVKDILWFNPATGTAQMWELFPTAPINVWNLGTLGPGWSPAIVGDFNGDGRADILWRNGATNVIWYMTAGVAERTQLMPNVDPSWQPVAVLDATGAGRDDIIWLNTGGSVVRWQLQGIDLQPNVAVIAVQGTGWQVVGQR